MAGVIMRSIRRIAFVAATVATVGLVSLAAPEAKADLDVNVFVGPPVGFWGGAWVPGRWITCAQGANLLAYRGFNRIQGVDCGGPIYYYRARRGGIWYRVRVNARRAVITNAVPI
jgi:hypothetical protein